MKNNENLDSIDIESSGVFYIYPGGIMGKVLGKMVEFAEGIGDYAEFSQIDSIENKNNIESESQKAAQAIKEVKIIDDANSEICLEKFKEELLKSRAVVHLADNKLAGENTKTCDILSEKLNALGIKNERESIEKYAKICAKKLGEILKQRKWENAVGVELSGVGGDKHNGFLAQNLQKICKDLKIIYFCNFTESYNRIKAKIAENTELAANCLVLCVPADYTFLFDNLKFIIKTSYKDKGAAPVVYLGHALSDWSHSKIENLEKMCDYLCIGVRGFEPILENGDEFFENSKLAKTATTRGFEIIKSGYLGFEPPLKEIEAKKATLIESSGDSIESKRDCVLFLPYDENESIEFLRLAKSAVNAGFKAIYRSREIYPVWKNNKKITEIFESLQKEPNFTLDRGLAIAPSSYLDSFCCVCAKTTSRYTFPLLALAPSICFNPYPHALPSAFGLRFTEILKEKDFIEILKKLHKEQDLWEQNLKDFRVQNAYNFGHSSEFLAKFLKKKFEL